MTSLIMLCRVHNNPHYTRIFRIQCVTAVVDLPDCDCCTCGCNDKHTGGFRGPSDDVPIDCCVIL